jgi:hypothetical protein
VATAKARAQHADRLNVKLNAWTTKRPKPDVVGDRFRRSTSEARVNLMFHRGARIKGEFPHLEGDGPSARFMRFGDLAEVEARDDELGTIVRTWCSMMTPPID